MSSVNPYFTFTYSQPEEYRFCHDSVFLARKVFENLSARRVVNALDLCSGVGIIGLDFLYHLRNSEKQLPSVVDFVEVQEVYQRYFSENIKRLGQIECEINFLNINYEKLLQAEFKNKYDLILCNPPYFWPGQGMLSPSEFKNRCRFFIDSDFKTLFRAIDSCLSKDGEAYVLVRDLKANGIDTLKEVKNILDGKREIEVFADIRGTPLIKIH